MSFWDIVENFEKELINKYPQSFQWIKYENKERTNITISFISYENGDIVNQLYDKLDKESNFSWSITVNLKIWNKIYETCNRYLPVDETSSCEIK